MRCHGWEIQAELEEAFFVDHLQVESEQVGDQVHQGDSLKGMRHGSLLLEGIIQLKHYQELFEVHFLVNQEILFHRMENALCTLAGEARENVVGLRLIPIEEGFGDAPRILSVCSSCKGEENLLVLD